MTAATAVVAEGVLPRLVTPCVAWDIERRHCVVGLLFGAACCPDGGCVLCTTQAEWMRAAGFAEDAVARSIARMRRGMLDVCPVCGFPPPPEITAKSALPRLQRVVSEKSGSSGCEICGRPLARGRRRYCSSNCERLREHRAHER